LIYGLPEQSLETWKKTVRRILDLHPEHISAYALTLEHGTPFGRWASKGLLPLPDPDLAAEMYEWAGETFEESGYIQYEISNWARDDHGRLTMNHDPSSSLFDPPSFACRHNLQYWRSLPYLAFGAGAHGYANGYRYSNALRIKTYIDRLKDIDSRTSHLDFPLSPAAVNQHRQSARDDMIEFMMTGLRLTREGVSSDEFEMRFGVPLHEKYGKEIDELLKLGLVEESPSLFRRAAGVRLTQRGRLLGNQVFMRFL